MTQSINSYNYPAARPAQAFYQRRVGQHRFGRGPLVETDLVIFMITSLFFRTINIFALTGNFDPDYHHRSFGEGRTMGMAVSRKPPRLAIGDYLERVNP